jgi:hypothetical protein
VIRFGTTISATASTKSGPVTAVVNVITSGPNDGAAAVMRDLREALAKVPRLEGADVSPVAELFGEPSN